MINKNNHPYVCDSNEAAADVAYRLNELVAIYPITPATSMGELADVWAAEKRTNWEGLIPHIVEMQSEAGVSGVIHGALQTGALATTFTSSQGMLLMIPNMYHISAELSPTVFHVSSRAVASQGMVIYSEHSDVMATRATGFAMLASSNTQEAHDMAALTQMVSLKTRVPFVHFFDGFRTSHEVTRIERISDEQLKQLIDADAIRAHRQRKLSPENPVVRGTIQSYDTYFQGRESVNSFYNSIPETFEAEMKRFERVTGRTYHIMEYIGHPQAERVIVVMASGAETVHETVDYLQRQDEKVGLIHVRLFQPFSSSHFLALLPKTCKAVAVLDRTKEPGAGGEPLYQKVAAVMMEALASERLSKDQLPKVIGGRFGLSGKEFTPGMVKAIFDELKSSSPKTDFTIGIQDDLTERSLNYDAHFDLEPSEVIRAIFYGLGSDGTVGANKNTIKIIGEETPYFVQAYFLYDPKKSGSKTISHLRLSPKPIRSAYLIQQAQFIACHQFQLLERINVLANAMEGATFLLNAPFDAQIVWDHLPRTIQKVMIDKKIKFYVIDASAVAHLCHLGQRINTIMQTCFFYLSHIVPKEEAIAKIKESIRHTYQRKGQKILEQNYEAVDQTIAHLQEVKVPHQVTSSFDLWKPIESEDLSEIVKETIIPMILEQGDQLPVSQVPNDGTFPIHTTRLEKRNVSRLVPEWIASKCIQCGRCSFVCPHGVIRAKSVPVESLKGAPASVQTSPQRAKDKSGEQFILQPFIEDCVGCGLCVEACPVSDKALQMVEGAPRLETERKNIEFFDSLPYRSRASVEANSTQAVQLLQPLFEFSGACAGCGEASYVRLLSQLFGHRAVIANACGCSSVFGGTLPAIPWAKTAEGQGPAWSSSLFEDNAEFGLGFRLTADIHRHYAQQLLKTLSTQPWLAKQKDLIAAILNSSQETESEISAQHQRVKELKKQLLALSSSEAKSLWEVADYLVKHSMWAIGGDGWAYDIGFGGIDHILAGPYAVKMLVLDTEVYSNTGGQSSKATPRGAVAKFAVQGKSTAKKDLGLIAMTYGTAYVAQIAMGANPVQTLKAFLEAESYEGPSIIMAYCPCIAHGIDTKNGLEQQKLAVKSGYWPLYRFDPRRAQQGLNPMQLDSERPSIPLENYLQNEGRYRILAEQNPEAYKQLLALAEADVKRRWEQYERWIKG